MSTRWPPCHMLLEGLKILFYGIIDVSSQGAPQTIRLRFSTDGAPPHSEGLYLWGGGTFSRGLFLSSCSDLLHVFVGTRLAASRLQPYRHM